MTGQVEDLYVACLPSPFKGADKSRTLWTRIFARCCNSDTIADMVNVMAVKTKIILAAGGVFLVAFVFVIGLGNRGAVDLYQLTLERNRAQRVNSELRGKNQALRRTIERLKSDPAFIESIARTELGMTGKDEVVVLRKRKKK